MISDVGLETASNILLVLCILVLLFAAYEEAGLRLKGWHTISWYAHHLKPIRIGITGAFIVAGITGAIWFWNHSGHFIPR